MKPRLLVPLLALFTLLPVSADAAPIKALIVTGQNNHTWQLTTPLLKKDLEDTGLFTVDVATTPPKGGDMSTFKPRFSDYAVVISNYMGESWSAETNAAFVDYVRNGGGFVSVHSADNAFPAWKEYNEIIGLGGWEGRDEKSGPYVYWRDGQFVRDSSPGVGGHHGRVHPFQIVMRDTTHPITRGLPPVWMHSDDELYDQLRGPAENMTILATAFADPATGGIGRHEPMMMVLTFGKGRIFHTPLGHAREGVNATRCVGFITIFQRGTEWAATGEVTQKVPADFPTADTVSVRKK
jgi:type 1 glutamine amidotransferase